MKTIIVVAKCLHITGTVAEFHFKGVCMGQGIHKVLIDIGSHVGVRMDVEYLVYVSLESIVKGVLKGNAIKIKPLPACWEVS
jgi:hypothetical protein